MLHSDRITPDATSKIYDFSELQNGVEVFYQGNEGNEMNFQKRFDISNLWLGDYYAKMKVGGDTYYHYFNVD